MLYYIKKIRKEQDIMAVLQLKDKNNKPIKDKQGRSWYFKTYYTSLSGERKQYKSKKYISKHDAEEAERVFIMSMSNKIENNTLLFENLISLYLDYQKDKVKMTTLYDYNKYLKYFEELYKIKVVDFDIKRYNLWKSKINKIDLSTRYKQNIYKFLKGILNYANNYLEINIYSTLNKMTNFNDPNELKKEMSFYTPEEFQKFISQEEDLKYKVYFETLYYLGLRKGEANALRWNDIDFKKHIVSITKSLTLKMKGIEYVILSPKTKSSIRTLPLSKTLENELKMLFKQYNQYNNFQNDWFVFGGPTPLKDTTIANKKHKNCVNAQIKEIRIHDFRHSCASLLISNGASIALVSRYLGHSNITTTLNTYTHMFKNELTDIVNVIDNLKL